MINIFLLLLSALCTYLAFLLKKQAECYDEITNAFDEFDNEMETIKGEKVLQEYNEMLLKGPVNEVR